MLITKSNKSFSCLSGIVLFFLIISCFMLTKCGFATIDPNPTETVIIETKTKYKVIVTTPCSFRVTVNVSIPNEYEHYKQDLHQLTGIYGDNKTFRYLRGSFGSWDSLSVTLPCGACAVDIKGMVSVLDDRVDLMPWGCGRQRPPVLVNYVNAHYVSPKGAKTTNEAQWQDEPPLMYDYTYMPMTTSQEGICDEQPVLFDLNPACQVLVDAGVIE